jgi:hypothetical protein
MREGSVQGRQNTLLLLLLWQAEYSAAAGYTLTASFLRFWGWQGPPSDVLDHDLLCEGPQRMTNLCEYGLRDDFQLLRVPFQLSFATYWTCLCKALPSTLQWRTGPEADLVGPIRMPGGDVARLMNARPYFPPSHNGVSPISQNLAAELTKIS